MMNTNELRNSPNSLEVTIIITALGKEKRLAGVSGRKEKFASVWPYAYPGMSFEFSWDAVLRAIQTGNPLQA